MLTLLTALGGGGRGEAKMGALKRWATKIVALLVLIGVMTVTVASVANAATLAVPATSTAKTLCWDNGDIQVGVAYAKGYGSTFETVYWRPYLQQWDGYRWQTVGNGSWESGRASANSYAGFGLPGLAFAGGQNQAYYRILHRFYWPSTGADVYRGSEFCQMHRFDVIVVT